MKPRTLLLTAAAFIVGAYIYVLATTPAGQAQTAPSEAEIVAAIDGSDDFGRYKRDFIYAVEKTIRDGTCTMKDFQYMGGWVRSTSKGTAANPVYFTYCGNYDHVSGRVYFQPAERRIFK